MQAAFLIFLILATLLLLFILILQFKLMASQEQFTAVLARIDTATNAIAARITSLEDSIRNAGLDEATENEFLGKIEGVAAQLEAIGKEPEA